VRRRDPVVDRTRRAVAAAETADPTFASPNRTLPPTAAEHSAQAVWLLFGVADPRNHYRTADPFLKIHQHACWSVVERTSKAVIVPTQHHRDHTVAPAVSISYQRLAVMQMRGASFLSERP
jgi:hypothetical protein